MSEKGMAYRKVGSFLQSTTLVAGDPFVTSHSDCMHRMCQLSCALQCLYVLGVHRLMLEEPLPERSQ